MSHAISWDCPSCKRPGKLVPASMGDPAFWICANTNCGNMNAVPAPRREDAAGEERKLRFQRIMETYSDDARRHALIECELEGELRDAAIHLDDYSNGILAGTNEYLKTDRTPAIRLLIAALIESRAALSTAERERGANTLSADDVEALRFCVTTAEHCCRSHEPRAYISAMGKLARAYDIIARVPSGGET